MGGPGLQQRAIHREVLIAEQRLDLWSAHQLLQEAANHIIIEKQLAVFVKGDGVPDRIVGAQADKPALQKVFARCQLRRRARCLANFVTRLIVTFALAPLSC